MLWLQTPPWGRWIVAALIAAIALWVEFRPDPLVEHPFATEPIAVGDAVDASNTEMRKVPSGLFAPVELGHVAIRAVTRGEPVLTNAVGDSTRIVPNGWWMVSLDVPPGAARGDAVRLVLLDRGTVVDGVVAMASSSDGFDSTGGAVAIHPDQAGEVAAAAIDGRVAVLISTG